MTIKEKSIRGKFFEKALILTLLYIIALISLSIYRIFITGWLPEFTVLMIFASFVSLLYLFHNFFSLTVKSHLLAILILIFCFHDSLISNTNSNFLVCIAAISIITFINGKQQGIIYSFVAIAVILSLVFLIKPDSSEFLYNLQRPGINFLEFIEFFLTIIFVFSLIVYLPGLYQDTKNSNYESFNQPIDSVNKNINLEQSVKLQDNPSIKVFNEYNEDMDHKIGSVKETNNGKLELTKLKESEDRYRKLFQNLNVVFILGEIIVDADGKPCDFRYLEVNQEFEKVFNIKSLEIIGKTVLEVYPNTEKYWIEKCGEVASAGIPMLYENFSNEVKKYLELVIYSPLKGQFAILGTDITSRKLAEQALIESESRFRLLAENSTDIISRISLDGVFRYVSPASSLIMGFDPDELVGRNVFEFIHPEDIPDIKKGISELLTNTIATPAVYRFCKMSGQYIWLETTAHIVVDEITGEPLEIHSSSRDVTKRKKAEEALLESEERYRTVVSNTPVATFVLDDKGVFTLSEGKGLSKLGLNPGQLVGLSIFEVYKQNPLILESVKSALQGISRREEIVIQSTVFDMVCSPVFDNNGEVFKVIIIANDITGRKTAEIKIQEQNIELQELNSTKDKFFSIIAHDLRSPFNSIIGLSDILVNKMDMYETDKTKLLVTSLNQSANQAYKLLENLLIWSRMQSGRILANVEKVKLKTIVEDVILLVIEMANSKNIKLSNLISNETVVDCDIHMTNTILRNLITNAIKFTPPNGSVSVSSKLSKKEIEIHVKDTGVGIPPDVISQLFVLKNNVKTRGTANEKGSGLGLSLCRELLEKQGGTIRVESEVNKGSCFIFTLPYNS